MRILIFSTSLWPKGSGGEFATYLYANLLKVRGFEITIALCNYDTSLRCCNFRIVSLPCVGFGKHALYIAKGSLEDLVKQADVIYLASAFWSLIPFIKRLGRPVVVHLHSYDPVCPVGSLYNFVTASTCSPEKRVCSKCIWLYERNHGRSFMHSMGSTTLNGSVGQYYAKLLGYADVLILVSYAHRNLFMRHLRSVLGSSVPKSHVIYNPIPDVRYSEPKEMNVGYFGGLSPLKGYHILLRAWARVFRRYRDKMLFMTKMGKLARSYILRRMNVYAHGRLEPGELKKLWSRIGVVVFPSIWQEPLPYVVIETLLHGRLLIASHVGGVPEIVGNAPGVKLVPPNDVDALADALDWALSMDKQDAIELGLRNREYVLRRFDNERSVRELIKVFEKVV